MFLRKLREELKYEETDLMKRFYENESTDVGETYKFNWKNIPISIVVLSILFMSCIISILCIGASSWKVGLTISAIISFVSLIYTVLQGFILKLKITVTKPHLFAPEQFEECFKEIVSNSLSKTNRALKWVKGDKSIQDLEKLVIVIDNIDRCSNDVAYNLLTDIKTFLSSEPYNIVFVIPVDDEALKKHIRKNNSAETDCNRENEEFLRKFFNVTIRIKPYGETDMYSFAMQICEKSGLNFKAETINVASKEYAKNPRRIIQLFNNLLAEINYYNIDFAQKNETLICCVLIIREEYPEYYKEILNSHKKFNEEYVIKDKNLDLDIEEKTKRFIRIAQTAVGKVEISDLSMVMTNSYLQFDDVDSDIKDAIDTFDSKKVISAYSAEKESIRNYIIHKLDMSIKNNFIDTDLVAYFDLVSQINQIYPLNVPFAKRIDEKVLSYLSIIIKKSKNHENFCKYALLRESQNNKKIKIALIEDAKRLANQQRDKYWADLIKAVLTVFRDIETSNALSSTYTIFHNSISSIEFSDEQFESLISEQFVQECIENLNKDNENEISLDTETTEYQQLKWIFENKKNISADTYGHLFSKVIGKDNSESRMRGKSRDEISKILDYINPLVNLIPDSKLSTQPHTLYKLIVSDRSIPHPSYADDSRYDSEFNFVDECLEDDKYVSEIIDFVINTYRISKGKIDIKREIDKLLLYKNLDKEFILLVNKGFTLKPILASVFDYENDHIENERLILLEHCFNQKNKTGEYSIEEEKAKNKLNTLLFNAHNNKSPEVFLLLEKLLEQEQLKYLLTTLIVEKDSKFINSLPHKFMKLAVSSFRSDNYSDFAHNFDFLLVIMQNGNNFQKGFVIKILTAKLDNNHDIEHSLDLIESMVNIPSFDKSGLLSGHLDDYQRRNKESISQDNNKRINNIKKQNK